jgi:TPR repeat protein
MNWSWHDLKLATHQGDPATQNKYGFRPQKSEDVFNDFRGAAYHLKLAADHGNAVCQHNYEICAHKSESISKDLKGERIISNVLVTRKMLMLKK